MSQAGEKSFFNMELDPLKQASWVLIAILSFSLLLWIPSKFHLYKLDGYHFWTISTSFTLLYAVGNSVYSLGTSDFNRYWGRSLLGYGMVALGGGFIAYLFSGLCVFEVKSFSWIYIVFTFVYLLSLSIVRVMRTIVDFAEKHDKRVSGEE